MEKEINTYVRPVYKSILLYLLVLLCSNAFFAIMSFVMTGMLSGDWNSIAKDTVFGDIPVWFVLFLGFATFSPLLCFPLYFAIVPHKYDKEFSKKLIPYCYDKQQPMYYPKAVLGIEPVWFPNKEFTTTLRFVSIKEFHNHSFAVVQDSNDIRYLMFANRFNNLFNDKTEVTGTFTFDTNWKITNIMKV